MRSEDKHAREEVQCSRISLGVHLAEFLLGLLRQVLDVALGTLVANEGDVVICGRAQRVDHSLHLVQLVFAWEDRRTSEQLSQDAAYGPHINLLRVVRGVQDHFGGTLPPGDHLLSQHTSAVDVGTAGQP